MSNQKTIVYIGNFLSANKQNPAPNVVLTEALKATHNVFFASAKQNVICRLFDMVRCVLRHRSANTIVVIDVFSSLAFYFAVLVSLLCRLINQRYVLVLHGGDLPNRYKTSPKLCATIFSNAISVVSPSVYLKEKTECVFPVSVMVISNPLNIKMYKPIQRTYAAPSLVWLRSFHTIYNPQMAIHVLNRLRKEFPDASLLMIGPDKDGTMAACKLLVESYQLEKFIEFTGFLEKPEMIRRASECNIFINTTNFDNAPVTLLEALALGIPVVSTNVGGIPYLVKNREDAILVDSNDIDAMVNGITRVMHDSMLRNQLIRGGLKNIQKRDIHDVVKQWEIVLNETL